MVSEKSVKKNHYKKLLPVSLGIAAALVLACAVYLGDYYRADMDAILAFETENPVVMQMGEDGRLVFEPKVETEDESENPSAGFIFYPGGKVEYTAYVPLMKVLASEGVHCVLVEMPFNLAVFDIQAADGIREMYPEIEDWYIGGHSLGGSMAATYVSAQADEFEGLVLLGAYSTADLSATDLEVLSIYGSEDMVMNRENYGENKGNLPADFTEYVIEGGCHAHFGMYGAQEGDGVPAITNEEQICLTAEAILSMMADRD